MNVEVYQLDEADVEIADTRQVVEVALVGAQGIPGPAGGEVGILDQVLMRANDGTVHAVRLVYDQGIYTLTIDQNPTT